MIFLNSLATGTGVNSEPDPTLRNLVVFLGADLRECLGHSLLILSYFSGSACMALMAVLTATSLILPSWSFERKSKFAWSTAYLFEALNLVLFIG